MTVVGEDTGVGTVVDTVVAEPRADEDRVDEPLAKRRDRGWKRALAIALVAILGAAMVVALFEGPVAATWYRTRQHHLGADLTAEHSGIALGQALAVMQIPRLHVNVVVAEGASESQLRSGPGHAIDTPRPGRVGNSVIVGHRHGWGGPFGSLGKARRGDLIAVQPRGKAPAVYTVTTIKHVSAGDGRLLAPAKGRRLTLVTGDGGTFSDDRLVVAAVSGGVAPLRVAGAQPEIASSGSAFWSRTFLFSVLAFLLGFGILPLMRPRYHPGAVAVVTVPVFAIATVWLLLSLDVLAPALR